MDLNKAYINRALTDIGEQTKLAQMKAIGFQSFNRTIQFFVDTKKNVHNIEGNDIITEVSCIITNTSVYTIHNGAARASTKTVYICEAELPSALHPEMIQQHFEHYVDRIMVRPLYAFSNDHVDTNDGKFYDFGLSLIDLSSAKYGSVGAIHLRDPSEANEKMERFLNANKYNPRFYSTLDSRLYEEEFVGKLFSLEDYIDSKTTMLFNRAKPEVLTTWVNDIPTEGIDIDKRLTAVDEFMESLFVSYLLHPMKNIEFVYDTLQRPGYNLNITKLQTFARFCDDAATHYALKIQESIYECVGKLIKSLNEDFYVIFCIGGQFVIADIMFYAENKRVRIVRPIHKQYGDYVLNFEASRNDIYMHGTLVVSDAIESATKGLAVLENLRMVEDIIGYVDAATQSVEMLVESQKSRLPSSNTAELPWLRKLNGLPSVDRERSPSNRRN